MMVKAILALLAAGVATNSVVAQTVMTSGGTVQGASAGATDRFLGIPFAKPPVGALRWAAPQPAAAWNGTLDATKSSAACYQSPPQGFGPYTPEYLISGPVSEDCLYLNVWKPKTAAKLPVFVFIHGGGFGSGSTAIPIYDGADLASKGVVVVTINYRLGVFGYLAHPALTAESAEKSSGNYGVQDMIAALRWVKANIAKFGGDASNVTVMGQSAGAAAVNDLLMSPAAKGLFHRAIAESGSGMGVGTPTLAQAETYGQEFAKTAGAASIADLRAMSAEALQRAASGPPPVLDGRPRARPTIRLAPNADGTIIAANPEDAGRPVSDVPLLTGFNADEATPPPLATAADFETMVRERYGALADRLIALYPHATLEEARASAATLGRDRYVASLILWAAKRGATGQRVYTYFYDHPYPATPDGKSFGAFHTSEVPYVLGALGKGGRTFTDKDRAVSAQLQDRWIAFMRTGRPQIAGYNWPPAEGSINRVMRLGDTLGLGAGVSSQERFEAFRDYVAAGGKLSLF